MDARVARTLETASGADFRIPSCALDSNLYLGAEAIAVRFVTDGLDPQPVAGGRNFIPQQNGGRIQGGNQQILAAAIPEVGGQGGTAYVFFRQRAARFRAYFFA